MLNSGIIEVNYLTIIIASIAILSGLLIILQFSRQKYENQFRKIQSLHQYQPQDGTNNRCKGTFCGYDIHRYKWHSRQSPCHEDIQEQWQRGI